MNSKYLVFLMFIIPFVALSQEIVITGKVTDKSMNEGIPGANILIKGTTIGTITDIDGSFNLNVNSPDDILIISFIGYKTVELPLNGQTTVEVSLEEGIELEELVVVGYGVEQKKVSTAASSIVTSDEITKLPILRVEQAIQGRASGVVISQNSGSPGSGLTVRIRGIGTPNNSDPLYVVDGIRTGGIDFLNPSDIERIDVLKDAASTAIYGVAAANGVILITTKKGKTTKPAISVSSYYGVQQLQRKVELLDAYQYNDLYKLGTPKYSTDWQDALIGVAPIMDHNINISGKTENSNYSVSGGYFKQNGIVGAPVDIEKSRYERITFSSNVARNLTDKFQLDIINNFTYLNRRTLPENSEIVSVPIRILAMPPSVPIYNEDDGKPYNDVNTNSDLRNPVSTILTHFQTWNQYKLFNTLKLSYDIIENLKISVRGNLDYAAARQKLFQPSYDFGSGDQRLTNTLTEQRYSWFNWTVESFITYDKTIGSTKLSFLYGGSVYKTNSDFLSASNQNLETNNFDDANLGLATGTAVSQGVGGWIAESALASTFGKVTIDYAEKYILTANLRVDGSSKFGPKNRWGVFPSVSGAWIISEESFFKSIGSPVNYSKLRVSWGTNGNENIGNYGYYSKISAGLNYIFGTGEEQVNGSTILTTNNEELKWEKSEQLDLGLEVGLFQDKLRLEVDYFRKLTNDVLVRLPIPAHVGLAATETNAGNVLNQGLELGLNYRSNINEFNYSFNTNFSYLKNEVTSLGNGGAPIIAGILFHNSNEAVSQTRVGFPIASFFTYKTNGIFQNTFEIKENVGSDGSILQPDAKPGDFRFVDTNNDNVIDEKDKVFTGKPMPDYIIGFTGNFDYKGIDLSFFFQSFIGNDIFRGYVGYQWGAANLPSNILDHWTAENKSNTEPGIRSTPLAGVYSRENTRVSDYYIEDGSFLKLKNIQLGYTIPDKFTSRLKINSLRVYTSVTNIFTWTKYSGFDPEIGSTGSQLELGIDKGFYPAARTYIFGIQLNF